MAVKRLTGLAAHRIISKGIKLSCEPHMQRNGMHSCSSPTSVGFQKSLHGRNKSPPVSRDVLLQSAHELGALPLPTSSKKAPRQQPAPPPWAVRAPCFHKHQLTAELLIILIILRKVLENLFNSLSAALGSRGTAVLRLLRKDVSNLSTLTERTNLIQSQTNLFLPKQPLVNTPTYFSPSGPRYYFSTF